MPLESRWRDWYHFRFEHSCLKTGSDFESFVSSILTLFHDDFMNPSPSGTLGDGGCDGLAGLGTILYACYGARPLRDAERKLAAKIKSDFERGLAVWNSFNDWRFVTNASPGPISIAYLSSVQLDHSPTSARPISIQLWRTEKLWNEIVSKLPTDKLNLIFPGAPGIANIDLSDLIPLLDSLRSDIEVLEDASQIRPVPVTKMAFNNLSVATQLEFNTGRLLAPRIDLWFSNTADPNLRDAQGERFRQIYLEQSRITREPTELIERLYVSLGGPDIRTDSVLANSVYAVTSYFFDTCHIFDEPPSDFQGVNQVAIAD